LLLSTDVLEIEHKLAKVGVEGSNPFARSNKFKHLADPRK
jgi:hypothetical protein